MFKIPQQARRWRLQQTERSMQQALLDSLSHLVSGRFVRARKAAELVEQLESAVAQSGERLSYAGRLRTLTYLLAAESAHALQDRTQRELHFQKALDQANTARDAHDLREGVLLRAARWSFDDRDAAQATTWLDQLPQGAGRRTLALRLRFKAARLAGQSHQALELARLLTKHRAFSENAGKSIARGLAIEMVRSAHDPMQLQRVWESLEPSERQMSDVAMEAAQRLLDLGGETATSRLWLLPVWDAMVRTPEGLLMVQRVRLVRLLELGFARTEGSADATWLSRIEAAQMSNPRDPVLQYLAGVVCMRLQLWGKAQQMMRQSLSLLEDKSLKRDAWRALAELAEQREDPTAATEAYREALQQAI
jgi:HemY protein